MVACNVPHPWPPQNPELLTELWRSWYTAALAFLPHPAVATWTARRILTQGNVRDPFSPAELDAFIGPIAEPARARCTSELYRHYLRSVGDGLKGEFAERRLRAPALLLFGERDLYVTAKILGEPADWEPHADDLRVELVPDSGHFIVDEKPELVTERALAHFGAERGSDGAT